MPAITLRRVGMSFLVEGLADCGLDGPRFRQGAEATYGVAVGTMMAVATPGDDPTITALIVDCKADTWDGLRLRVEGWIADQGALDASWDEVDAPEPIAILRFEL